MKRHVLQAYARPSYAARGASHGEYTYQVGLYHSGAFITNDKSLNRPRELGVMTAGHTLNACSGSAVVRLSSGHGKVQTQ